jgi:hypothetical protein
LFCFVLCSGDKTQDLKVLLMPEKHSTTVLYYKCIYTSLTKLCIALLLKHRAQSLFSCDNSIWLFLPFTLWNPRNILCREIFLNCNSICRHSSLSNSFLFLNFFWMTLQQGSIGCMERCLKSRPCQLLKCHISAKSPSPHNKNKITTYTHKHAHVCTHTHQYNAPCFFLEWTHTVLSPRDPSLYYFPEKKNRDR